MTISKAFKMAAVKVGATTINGITRWSDNTNSQLIEDTTTGGVFPRFVGIGEQKPTLDFVTKQVATMLGLAGINGTNIGGLTGGIVAYLQKLAHGGARDTAGHLSYTINDGILVPVTLSISHGQDAELTVQAAVGYDGTNEPIIIASGATLPTDTDTERFTLGSCTVESVNMTGIESVEITFGLQVTQQGSDGDVWPTLVYIDTGQPKIRITCMDASLYGGSNFPIDGKAVTHANTTIYLRKRAPGGTLEANASTVHIQLTASGMAHVISGSEGEGKIVIEIVCNNDGTNAPIVITTAVAIP